MSNPNSGSSNQGDDENNPEFRPPLPPGPPPEQPPPPLERDLEFDILMMKHFRIKECPQHLARSKTHNPLHCPYIHPGQVSRRSLSLVNYSAELCTLMHDCEDGDECEFAHNIFEHCLHPIKFRRTRCCHGYSCGRLPCLFPHNPVQLFRATVKPPLYILPPPRPLPRRILPLPPNLRMPPPRPIQWLALPPPRFSRPPRPFRPQGGILPPFPLVLVQPRRMPPLPRPPRERESGLKRKIQCGTGLCNTEHDDQASTSEIR